jgi:hypothetical protein
MARYLGRNMSRFAQADMARGNGGANQNQTVQSQIQEQAQILATQISRRNCCIRKNIY